MITPYNLLGHELLGLHTRARTAEETVEGTVDAETKNTLTLKTQKGSKRVIKGSTTLIFTLPLGAVVEVKGRLLEARPEDRVKKRHRIRY